MDEQFNFYWKQTDENNYKFFMSQSSYILGELEKYKNCNRYYFNSDFFGFYMDYNSETDGFETIEELLDIIRIDLIQETKEKIQLMTEWLSALCME